MVSVLRVGRIYVGGGACTRSNGVCNRWDGVSMGVCVTLEYGKEKSGSIRK